MYEWNAKCEYILTADIDGKYHRMISKRDSKKHKAIRDKGGAKMSAESVKDLVHRYFVEQ